MLSIFLHENFLLVVLDMVNIWHTFDMNEILLHENFCRKNFVNEINANYGSENQWFNSKSWK